VISIPNPLESFALARPDHPALVVAGGPTPEAWSASRLSWAVALRAAELAGEGVARSEVVALCGSSSARWVIDFFALGWLGAVAAPLVLSAPPTEQKARLDALGPRFAIVHDEALRTALRGHARTMLGAGSGSLSGPVLPTPRAANWPLDETRLLIHSSGTSGPAPRAIALDGGQLIFSAMGSAIRLGHALDDRWLLVLPLHHVGGLSVLIRGALLGITVLLLPRFDAHQVATLLDAGEASLVSLVPAMLESILDARPNVPFPARLRAILLGGEAAPKALLERAKGLPIALTYGMTETASQVATRFPGELSPAGGAGPPLPFARVEEEGLGRLRVTGPIAPGGSFLTSDIGHVDALGRVHPLARADLIFISGGENVSPEEIEAVLIQHPKVQEALVAPVPDARFGRRPAALIVAPPGPPPAERELEAWCRERLAAFKVPVRFELVPALPRSDSGKPARSAASAILTGASSASASASPPAPASASASASASRRTSC
jgi:O-succinylbenzoic acid--CoA ligase